MLKMKVLCDSLFPGGMNGQLAAIGAMRAIENVLQGQYLGQGRIAAERQNFSFMRDNSAEASGLQKAGTSSTQPSIAATLDFTYAARNIPSRSTISFAV